MDDAVTPGPAGRDLVDAAFVRRWLRAFGDAVNAQRGHLTELDSALGDADHGANLDRGLTAVAARLDSVDVPQSSADDAGSAGSTVPGLTAIAAQLKQAGTTLVSTVGGASGPLYGTLFLRMGVAAGTASRLEPGAFARALRAGLEGLVARGRAERGDKTMFDALAPACDALEQALSDGADLAQALQLASAAADTGRDATIPMLARKGRASDLGERSIGHQDPGATSAALLVAAAAQALIGAGERD